MGRFSRAVNLWLVLLIITSWLVLSWNSFQVEGRETPSFGVHPLPVTLVNWVIDTEIGDYFNEISPIPEVGYLLWSEFPVKVYVDTGDSLWREGMEKAIANWYEYLPLTQVTEPIAADISIKRSPPAPVIERNPETGRLEITRARAGLTKYELYNKEGILAHRMTIELKPLHNPQGLLDTATHELGHALGIWGHSQVPTDALYYAQSNQSQGISPRDVNTLKKIYQQPTALGINTVTK